jgi:hypothetical protein
LDTPPLRDCSIPFDHFVLDLDGATHGIENARKSTNSPSPVVLTIRPRCSLISGRQAHSQFLQRGECAFLVRFSDANNLPHRRRGSRRDGGYGSCRLAAAGADLPTCKGSAARPIKEAAK